VIAENVENRVSSLVVGGVFLFLLTKRERSALTSPTDLIARFLEFVEANSNEALASGKESGLINEVRQLGSGEPRSPASNDA